MAKAWVMEWKWYGEHRALKETPVYVLPARWGQSRVMDFMRCIYFNNRELFPVDLGLQLLGSKNVSGLVEAKEGLRLSLRLGGRPTLICGKVRDLEYTYSEENKIEYLRWTRPAGERWKYETESMEVLGIEVPREAIRQVVSGLHDVERDAAPDD